MPITNYNDILDGEDLYEGQIALAVPPIVYTGFNSETAALIIFGRAVVQGVGDKDLLLPADANSVFRGIAVKTDIFEKRSGFSLDSNGDMGYPIKYPVSYLTRGVIGVKVAQNVTPTSPVFWVHTTNSTSVKGMFRIDADTNRAVQLSTARFLKTGAAGSVVPLAINLP